MKVNLLAAAAAVALLPVMASPNVVLAQDVGASPDGGAAGGAGGAGGGAGADGVGGADSAVGAEAENDYGGGTGDLGGADALNDDADTGAPGLVEQNQIDQQGIDNDIQNDDTYGGGNVVDQAQGTSIGPAPENEVNSGLTGNIGPVTNNTGQGGATDGFAEGRDDLPADDPNLMRLNPDGTPVEGADPMAATGTVPAPDYVHQDGVDPSGAVVTTVPGSITIDQGDVATGTADGPVTDEADNDVAPDNPPLAGGLGTTGVTTRGDGASADVAAWSGMVGVDVYDVGGQEIGEIQDITLVGGRPDMVLVEYGGTLGIGERVVAVPVSSVTLSEGDADGVVLTGFTEADLDAMPEYELSDDMATVDRLNRPQPRGG